MKSTRSLRFVQSAAAHRGPFKFVMAPACLVLGSKASRSVRLEMCGSVSSGPRCQSRSSAPDNQSAPFSGKTHCSQNLGRAFNVCGMGSSQARQFRSSVGSVAVSLSMVAAPNKLLVPTREIAARFGGRVARAAQHRR